MASTLERLSMKLDAVPSILQSSSADNNLIGLENINSN